MYRLLLSITVLSLFALSLEAAADIYRLDGDDEVVSFTDSPSDKRYQLVMKEQRSRISKEGKEKPLPGPRQEGGVVTNSDSSSRQLPVDGIITSQTGFRNDPFSGSLKHHNGLDIAAPSGTPVKPVAAGTVIFSGWKSGYGNTVILDHADGMVTVYAHHSSNSVREGDRVDTGSVIALTGSTGRSTGPHLHFEAWQGGVNISRSFMPGNSTARSATRLADAPIRRFLQEDGTILFTNLR